MFQPTDPDLRALAGPAPAATAPQGLGILRPGDTCWCVGRASRAAALIDAEAYFKALHSALLQARRSIVIVGWDFDAAVCLLRAPGVAQSGRLSDLLRDLVEEHTDLEIRILIWAFSTVHAPGASLPLLFGAPWQDHPRIHLKLDNPSPLYGSHHQKIVVIDDVLAFAGGIDLTVHRWDSRAHLRDDPRRVDHDGERYGPVHDVQMVVGGEAARCLGIVAAARWRTATGEALPASRADAVIWPAGLEPGFRDVDVGVSRTVPRRGLHRATREAERLNHAAIRAARRLIFIECQYFADRRIGKLLAERLAEEDGPEVVVLVPHISHSRFEQWVMDGNRDRILRMMKRADRFGRLGAFYPVTDQDRGCEIFLHSKVLVVDDVFLRIGSSNFNRRSTGLDTECDLAVEARDETARASVAAAFARLLAEHLGQSASDAARVLNEKGSPLAAIADRPPEASRLVPYEGISLNGPTHLRLGTRLLDPRGPISPASLFSHARHWMRPRAVLAEPPRAAAG